MAGGFTSNDNREITFGLPGFASVGKMAESNVLPPTPTLQIYLAGSWCLHYTYSLPSPISMMNYRKQETGKV